MQMKTVVPVVALLCATTLFVGIASSLLFMPSNASEEARIINEYEGCVTTFHGDKVRCGLK